MTFGEEYGIGAAEADSRRMFETFLEAGGNFVDTANIYNHGTSESMLGGFLQGHRDAIVLASKYSLSTDSGDPNAGGSHRKNLVQALEGSLARLNTGYLDLLWVHGWDPGTSLDELMRALDDQVRLGKVLHLGISNAPAWVIAAANTLARERGLTPFTAVQMHYNLVERSIEREFFQLAAAQDMAITAWSPLAGGLLSGKYSRDPDTGGRLSHSPRGERMLARENLEVAESLAAMAEETGCTPAQLALAWLRRRDPVPVIPIIGARTPAQLEDNLGCLEVVLEPEQSERLDALTVPKPEYPQSLLDSEFFQVMMYGQTGAGQ